MTYYELFGQRHANLVSAAEEAKNRSGHALHAREALEFAADHFERPNEKAREYLAYAIHNAASTFPRLRSKVLETLDRVYSRVQMGKKARDLLNSALLTLAHDPKITQGALQLADDHFSEASENSQLGLSRVVLAAANNEKLAEKVLSFIQTHFRATRQARQTAIRGALVEAIGRIGQHRAVNERVLSLITDYLGDLDDAHREKLLDTVVGYSLHPKHAGTVLQIVQEHYDTSGERARRKMKACMTNLIRAAARSAPDLIESIRQVAREKGLRLKAG